MRRPDSITATIALTVVVAMVLGFTLQRVVTTALPYFGFERRQELPKVEERFLLQRPGPGGRTARHPRWHAGCGQTDRPRRRSASASPPSPARRARAESGQSWRAGRRGDAPSHRSRSYRAATGDRRRSLSARGRESRSGRWTRREWYLDRSFPCERSMAPRRDQPGPAASKRPGGGGILHRQLRCLGDPLPCLGHAPVGGGSQAGRKAAFRAFRSGRSPRCKRRRSTDSAAVGRERSKESSGLSIECENGSAASTKIARA